MTRARFTDATTRGTSSRRRWSGLPAICLAAACGAAAQATSTPTPEPRATVAVESYFPLTKQSRWAYRVQDFSKGWTYRTNVRVFGPRHFDFLGRDGIMIEERYSSIGGPIFVEEKEPLVYYREGEFLHRVFLTYQAGKLVPQTGSLDSRYLPEILRDGASWESKTAAFQVGDGIGIKVIHRHVVSLEDESIEVPAGTFEKCFRVDTFSTHGPDSGARPDQEIVFYYSDWYAPDIGLVRTQTWDDAERTKERSRIELLEYEIADDDTGS